METIEPLSNGENIQRRRRPEEIRKEEKRLGMTRRWTAMSRCVLAANERTLERFVFFLARKPFAVVLTSVIIAIASCLGFIHLHVEKPSDNLFTAANSESRQDMQHAAKFFPLLDTRKEELIILPQHNENVLSKDCLNDAIFIHKVIVNISDYNELCARQQNDSCVISSPLQLSGAQFENIENLSSILLSEQKTPSVILSTGKTFKSSVETLLANFRSVNKPGQPSAWADALRIIYFVRKPTNKNESEKVLRFEKSFEIAITSIRQQLKCASVSFETGRTKSDAIEDVLLPELTPLCVSVLIIVIVLAFVLYNSTSSLGYLATALLTFVSILLPVICSAGIVSFAGLPLFPTAIFIPFLLLGKETSDLLIILRGWEMQRNVPLLKHRVSNCVAKAGFPVTTSSLFCSLLLGIAIKSSFAVISNFFILALVVCVTYTLVISTLVVIQLLSYRKQLKIETDSGFQRCSSRSSFIALHQKRIVKELNIILTSIGGRIISVLVIFVVIALFIIFALRPTERTGDVESFYQQKNYRNFNEAREKLFSRSVDTSVTFSGKLNYSKESVQQEIISVCKSLGKASYSQEESTCWISTLKRWARDEELNCLSSEFYNCLKEFLIHERNFLFKQDIRFDTTFRISASRVHLYMKKSNRFQEDKTSLKSLRKDLKETSPLKAVPASDEFFRLDDLLLLEEDTIHVLIFASISVFICSLITNASIVISGYLTVTFILLILETALIMQAWEVKLSHLSFLALFPGIVCSLTYSILVSQTFILSAKEKGRAILIDLLGYVSPSILWASFVSVVSSISLSFIFPSLKIIFIALIPLTSLLGVVHALVLLPPILCLAFEFLANCDSLNPTDIALRKANDSIHLMFRRNDERKLQCKAERPGIAIVGMSCQFPRAKGKDMFWDLLVKGKCSIGKLPTNRSEQHKNFHELYHPKRFVSGRLCATNGSYLDEIQKFDNTFFGISNQEARSMDPQQRILLQVVYEAIEDAGIRLEDLQNCRTGVFVGVMNLEFGGLMTDSSNYKKIDQFSSTGMTASIIANRVSFCLNLTGPSVAVDTACSSSLTALKIACDNLHNGDCEVAIVCAPNIILDHSMQIVSSMAGLLAPDGRCKSFDASGDGYGRGEGFAAVIVKLTAAALSDKDDMYCEIVACGLNNDGQSAVPITAPSAKMQAKLSKRVLQQSGMRPEDVDYFEAHGTGTAIGDVVEVDSIADVYTRETIRARKLRVGSVKSNLNHTESTAGLAGLIKVALMIKERTLVPTVNVNKLNPKLKLDEKNMIIQQTCEDWITSDGKPRVGAVNSFGYGGSNVHVILREVKSSQRDIMLTSSYRPNYVLTLSARSKSALKQMAKLLSHWLRDHVDDSDSTLTGNVCYSLNERRSQLSHRLALPFRVSSDASRSLLEYANENNGWEKLVSYGESNSRDQKLVFMFGGQGSQWYGMGRQLIECEPVFKEAIWNVSNIITRLGETWSLVEELMASEEVSRISANWLAQPATFAVQYATAQLLISWGIYPSAVLGHSLGEFAAATTAGVITIQEAVQLVLTRAALQEKCPNNGGMAALGLSEEKAINLLRYLKLENTLEVVAVNDANSVTVSGNCESVQALGDHLKMHSGEVFWRVLGTQRAFHTFHMESIQKPFHTSVKRIGLKPQLAKVPFYSTVVGEVISGQQLTSLYWWQNIRHHVQFFPATKHLLQDGYKQIVEISTQPILAHYVKQIGLQENLKESESPVVFATLPSKKVPIRDHHKMFLQNTVCKLYSLGYPIDWSRVQGNSSGKFIRLPTYPWKENRFWYRQQLPQEIIEASPIERSLVENQSSTGCLNSPCTSLADIPHPFLTKVMMTKPRSGLHCWETDIDLHRMPYLKDHALVRGGTVMPGATYMEMAFAMVKNIFVGTAGIELTDVRFSSLLTLPETQVRTLRLRLLRADRVNEAHFQITNTKDEDSEITLCNGSVIVDLLRPQTDHPKGQAFVASNLVSATVYELISDMEKMPLEWFNDVAVSYGFNYGPSFSIIKKVWRRDNKGVCLIEINHFTQKEAENYVIHPTILDACLQSCFAPLGASMTDGDSIVPVGFRSVIVYDIPKTSQLFCHVTAKLTEFRVFDIVVMSPAGNILLSISEFRVAEMTSLPHQACFSEIAYEVQWKESHESLKEDARPDLTCIVLKDSSQLSDALVERLKVAEVRVITVEPPSTGVCDSEAEKSIEAAFSYAPFPNDQPNIRIVNLWPAETSFLPNSFERIEQAQSLAFKTSSFLMKLMIQKKWQEPRLFLVTLRTQFLSGCNCSRDDISLPWGSTVWGLRRTANLEYLNLRVTAIDLSKNEELHDVALLAEEILGDSIEDEVAFRDGKRFINRIVRLQMSEYQCPTSHLDKDESGASLCLATLPFSRQLCLRKQSFSAPSRSELKIKLLYAWNPSESVYDLCKPNDCVFVSGVVSEVPLEGSHGFSKGDEVCGIISSGRVGSCLNINVSHAFLKPTILTLEQAAYIPGCLAMAFHVLQRLTDSEENCQKLLIHEANQGPGPATVLLVSVLGHRAYCTISETCSATSKSALLELGAEDVMYQKWPTLNGNAFDLFDAVLFFLQPSPNALQRSMRSLKKGGKLFIMNPDFEGDLVFSANKYVKYEGEDIADVLLSATAFQRLTLQGLELLDSKRVLRKLLELNVRSFDVLTTVKTVNASIGDSQQQVCPKPAKGVSFSVDSFATFCCDLNSIKVLPRGLDECGLKENRSYLVAGGMRGFGFEVARWMAENGAKTIVLLGRSKPSHTIREKVKEIETKTDIKVYLFQVDISSQEQMISFTKELMSLPSVAGIINTAMVLRDEYIMDLKFESFVEVMKPKIKGSFLLHQMSLNMDLDFFVMFSSMASIVGNMGQASYSAANAFQDALAMYRRQVLGLPGLSINWGPIGGAGVMVREAGVARLMTMAGLGFIDAKQGVQHMAKVLKENPARWQITLMEADWSRFLKSNKNLNTTRLGDISVAAKVADSQVSGSASLAQRIVLEKERNKRSQLVKEYIIATIKEWTGISSLSEVDLNNSLYSYGVDSTAALTLKMQLEADLQVSFEVFYFMQPDTTPVKLASDVASKLSGQHLFSGLRNEQSQFGESPEIEGRQSETDAVMTNPTTRMNSQVQVVPLYTPPDSAIKFFCVHPSHRYALSLVPISTGFQGQDLVSFYSLGFTDPTIVSDDWGGVRQLANHYVQLISKVQRHGPYFLGGYSYGGLLAYEMASILTERNQRVEFVAMIDTFPWSPHSAREGKTSLAEDNILQQQNVELQFENYLRKLALESLKMPADEYEALRGSRNEEALIDELQQKSLKQNVSTYDLRALQESLLKDHVVASRTHRQWQPPEILYGGHLTFLKCENSAFSPRSHSVQTTEEIWGGLVEGGTTVLVCPGDHYSTSELPHAHVTGSILATALLFSYRMLFPDFPRPLRTFSQRRAVEKYCSGVTVFLHSKKGIKRPHFGQLILEEKKFRLVLISKDDQGKNKKEKVKKIVDLKDLRIVQPGKFVYCSLKYSGRMRQRGVYESGNLAQIAAVVTSQRVYSFEFTDHCDLKAFCNMIEAIFSLTLSSV